jgi:hypothetical protein
MRCDMCFLKIIGTIIRKKGKKYCIRCSGDSISETTEITPELLECLKRDKLSEHGRRI